MPYEDAKTYRFNPFDLTKVWPHSDYPLIKVGTMTLNRNPENFFAQIEQAAFEPSARRAGHRLQPGQDAARPGVRLLRHAPLPDRPELPAAAGQPAPGGGQHLHPGRPDGLRAPRRRPGLRAELLRPRLRRRGRRGRPTAGRPTARWCARPTRCARTTTTSARPAPWSARSGTTRAARRSSRPSPGTSSAASRATCSSGPSSTGRASTPTPARRSRSWCARQREGDAPRRPARGRKSRRRHADRGGCHPGGHLTSTPRGWRLLR